MINDNHSFDDDYRRLIHCFLNDDAQSAYEIITNGSNIPKYFKNIPSGFRCFGRLPIPFLNMAASLGAYECVLMLLDQDVDINGEDGIGNLVTHSSCFSGNLKIVKLIDEYGCDFTLENKNEELPIHSAAENNQIEVVHYLLENDISCINHTNCFLMTPLSIAIQNNYYQLSKTLISYNSDLNVYDENHNTLIHFAVMKSSIEMVSFLLSFKKIPIDAHNFQGETSLLLAAKKGNIEIMKLLIQKGADFTLTDYKKKTLLLCSIESNNIDAVKFVISLNIPNMLDIDINNVFLKNYIHHYTILLKPDQWIYYILLHY